MQRMRPCVSSLSLPQLKGSEQFTARLRIGTIQKRRESANRQYFCEEHGQRAAAKHMQPCTAKSSESLARRKQRPRLQRTMRLLSMTCRTAGRARRSVR
eukprot:6208360-Pleurochrysis_carterae.AAC.1